MNATANSKSDRMLLIGMAVGLFLILVGIIVFVVFDKNVIQFVLAGLGLSGGNGLMSSIRSLTVDGPIRQQQAALDVAIQAKAADVPPPQPVSASLGTWRPGNPGGETQ